jgi:hypothetical protein
VSNRSRFEGIYRLIGLVRVYVEDFVASKPEFSYHERQGFEGLVCSALSRGKCHCSDVGCIHGSKEKPFL